jgi:hypothetical protein
MEVTMRYAVFALAVMAAPAFAQEVEIAETINGQMEAFRGQDVVGAFAYASPLIQGIFGTPENFGKMVEQGYPMVWTPGRCRCWSCGPWRARCGSGCGSPMPWGAVGIWITA